MSSNDKYNMTENTMYNKREKSRPLVLKCNNVIKKFMGRTALNSCNITLNKGEVLAIIGPEGHGKSTLAKLTAGLISPTKGSVTIRGVKAGRITNSVVSYQPEIPYFKDDMTVSDFMNMYGRFFNDFSFKKAYQLLKHFDISRYTRFENLSTTALFIVQVIIVSSRPDVITMIDNCRKNGGVLLLSQTAQGLDDITDKVAFLRHGAIVKEFYDADSFEAEFGRSLLNDVYKEVFKRA